MGREKENRQTLREGLPERQKVSSGRGGGINGRAVAPPERSHFKSDASTLAGSMSLLVSGNLEKVTIFSCKCTVKVVLW